MRKIKLSFAVVMLVIILITGCGFVKHIEDTNGEDNFNIETIEESRIVSNSLSHLSYNSLSSNINNTGSYQVKKLSGVYELVKIRANNEKITYTINSTCNSGNLRIVVVHDNQIVKEVNINELTTFDILNADGNYSLRLVGESANISLTFSITK